MKPLSSETAKLFKPLRFEPNTRLHLTLNDDSTHFTASFFLPAENPGDSWRHPSFRDMGAVKELIGRIPERRELTGSGCTQFEFGATDYTVALLAQLFPPSQTTFSDDARVVWDYIDANSRQQDKAAEVYAKWKEGKIVPVHTFEYPEEKDKQLSGYQQVAHYNSSQATGYALFMEQGTGKTPVTIARICNDAKGFRAKHGRCYRAIVVAPKNVRMNWQSEMTKFGTGHGMTVVLRGGDIRQTKQLIEAFGAAKQLDYMVIVVSYETLTKRWHRLGAIDWDLGILDEGHFIKWPETERAKTAMKLRDKCARRMILTGTPITNTPLDLFAQLEYLEKGGSGFISWKKFREFYGKYAEDGDGRQKLIGVQNMPFMQERLARMSFIISKAEALPDLPEKVYDIIDVEMTAEQTTVYENLRDRLVHEIEDELENSDQPQAMVMNNALTKLLRLAQVTSGILKWDDVRDDEGNILSKGALELFDPNPKIEALVEELKQRVIDSPKEKTIVWACFTPNIRAIQERLLAEGIRCVTYNGQVNEKMRDEAVHSFNNDPEMRVFIGNADAGGTGLNLLGYPPGNPDACDSNVTWVVYFSQNWKPTPRWQSEDRAHRRGTRVVVRITDMVVAGTVDEQIRVRVLQKKNLAMTVQDIRAILHSVLHGVIEAA